MSNDQFALMLYDMYQADTCTPPLFGKWKEDFKNISYCVWAVNEIKDFIAKQIYPRTYGSIDEFCELTQEFIDKTARYAKMNSENHQIFQAARDVAINILDLLEAMK